MTPRRRRPRILVCSPYGTNSADWDNHTALARSICVAVIEAGGAPLAPHLHYTQFLNDLNKSDREVGLECASAWLDVADAMLVYVAKGISDGMRREMREARTLGKKVQTFEEIEHIDVVLGWIKRHDSTA